MGQGVEVVAGGLFSLPLGLGLGRGLRCELGGFREIEDTDEVTLDIDIGGMALVVANLAAIGGKSDLVTGAEPGLELEPDGRGIDEDADSRNVVTGIGGTTGVGFDLRRKNEPVFFGLTESESMSDLDFDSALTFLEDIEETDTASERYAPSLAASVSYSVTSPSMDFDLSLTFFSFLLLLFFTFSSFFASFAAALASFSAHFAALASSAFLDLSLSFLLFPPSLTKPSLSYPFPLSFIFRFNFVPELCFKSELAEMEGAIFGKGIGTGDGDGVISDWWSILELVLLFEDEMLWCGTTALLCE